MKRSLLALVVGLTLVAARSAKADDRPTGKMGKSTTGQMGQMDEPKKHLSEVDIYLKDAMNNAKVVYEISQLQPGKLDATIERESLGNIDKALSGAQTHLQHIMSLPEAKVQDMDKVNDLQRKLTDAKAMVVRLRTAVRADNKMQVQNLTSQLFTSLKTADDTFSQIAEKQNLTRVDKIEIPEKQPVGGGRGEEMPPSEGIQKQPTSPTTPTPTPSPSETPPSKPQY